MIRIPKGRLFVDLLEIRPHPLTGDVPQLHIKVNPPGGGGFGVTVLNYCQNFEEKDPASVAGVLRQAADELDAIAEVAKVGGRR